jgi:hypothetical protein
MLPEAASEVNRRECWPENLYTKYEYYLKRSGNKSILTGQRQEIHRRWLRNLFRTLQGLTPKKKAANVNNCTHTLVNFKLQDNQVYKKLKTIKSHLFPA